MTTGHDGNGKLASETFAYDGGRMATAYVPEAEPEFVVFAADGAQLAEWGADLETADVPATAVIGAHGATDETHRLHEYSPGFDPERFSAHEEFFMGDVRRWAEDLLGRVLAPERTAVYGASAGGELALALGLRHPDVFGAILCASPGAGYRPPEPMPSDLPRTYLVAGMQEPFFLENASRWADALAQADAAVTMTQRAGEHGDGFWRAEFPLMVAWASSGGHA